MNFKFDWFVLPFTIGFTFVISYIIYKFYRWIIGLSADDKKKLAKYVFSRKILSALKEIFYESLLHRRIFKVNPVLGYMHMSLAFGWFLLILLGNIEAKIITDTHLNPAYYPIFLKYFEIRYDEGNFMLAMANFLMDLFLLFVLSGVVIAWIKRKRPSFTGMKYTTKHIMADRFALTALWFVFPLRLIAESITAGVYHNGSFLTGTLGHLLSKSVSVEYLLYPSWCLYSLSLGVFFTSLPFSRYMHIPTEFLLIIFRKAGIEKNTASFKEAEVHSCSRCGICIDPCQLNNIGITDIQSSYMLRNIRYNKDKIHVLENCLMCGRCSDVCPVGIDTVSIRTGERIQKSTKLDFTYSYLPEIKTKSAQVLYFAGCMSHLTPSIKKSMAIIFNKSGINWKYLDEESSICCGRPLKLAGQLEAAQGLIKKNIETIQSSGAKVLVTSCPICYKSFKEDYDLKGIEVLHHTQYIKKLLDDEQIHLRFTNINIVYHDPCELGRNSGVYLEPRAVLSSVAYLSVNDQRYDKGKSLCCGGSVANIQLSTENRYKITKDVIAKITNETTEAIVTACPLCKKTFSSATELKVFDISEIVSQNICDKTETLPISARKSAQVIEENEILVKS